MESIKVMPTEVKVLDAKCVHRGPDEPNCLMQLAHIHKLRDSEKNYDQHQQNLSMNMLRKREGLAAPLVLGMELYEAKKVGHLPFMQSSNLMEDVLLNRDETISFGDYLGIPENSETLKTPHMVMEKYLGIL